MKKNWVFLVFLFSLLFQAPSFGHEADVFVRLAERLVSESQGSQLARHLLTATVEGRAFSEALLGSSLQGHSEQESLQLTFSRLRAQGDLRLARSLEARLDQMEAQYVAELTAHPELDPDTLLARIAKENFETRIEQNRVVFLQPALGSLARAARSFVGEAVQLEELRKQALEVAARRPELKSAETLAVYEKLTRSGPAKAIIARLFPVAQVYRQLADEEMIRYTENLGQLLGLIDRAPEGLNPESRISAALWTSLQDQVPTDTIDERIRSFFTGKSHSFERALGDMTLSEVRRLLYGTELAHPSADSLLGKYLRETGSATVMRSFPLLPGSANQGAQRLVVAVSPESFQAFQKYFKRLEFMSIFGHAYVLQNGRIVSYNHPGIEFRLPREGTLLPQILLKTTEAQRAWQYLDLLKLHRDFLDTNNPAMRPDSLKGAAGSYCAAGAYLNCTQWIGNMPIGDRRVLEYSFPGSNGDPWAQVKPHGDPAKDFLPRIQRLKPFEHKDPLVRRVWKYPGNQEFSEVIGLKRDNLLGNFANPGWVISTILGPASAERVPVIFLVTPNPLAPIDPAFVPQFEAPM